MASALLEEAMKKEDDLAAELAAAQSGSAIPDELIAKALVITLSTTTCCNRGYILQGFPETLEQAKLLFGKGKLEVEGEEGVAEEAAEEGEPGAANTAAAPEFVITLEAEEAVIREKLLAQEQPSMGDEKLAEVLQAYAVNNADDSPSSVLALPALAEVEQLGPLPVLANTSIDSLLTKARVYLGQPRNYGPTDEEIAAKVAAEEADAAKVAAEEERLRTEREAAELAERARREQHESRRAAEVQQQEQELIEVRSIPLRNYLMQNVIPTLTEGLIEVCKLKPEDPVDYLAEYLFRNNPVEDEQFE